MFLSYYYLALVACQKMVITNTQMKNVAYIYIYIYIYYLYYILYMLYICAILSYLTTVINHWKGLC